MKAKASSFFRKFFPKKKKKDYGWKDEIREWIVSFVVAAVVYFLVLPAILGSSSPMVVVSSCSEAGYLNIGDIVIVKGAGISEINAPLVELDSFETFTPVVDSNEIRKIRIGGQVIEANDSNDIVVFHAFPSGAQIIHRAMALIKIRDTYFLITKGDANTIPDQVGISGDNIIVCFTENKGDCLSTAITKDNLVGRKFLYRIPLLGHVKLFFCDVMPFCDGHANAGTNYEFKLTC